MKKIAVLTSGGDAPGMNAALRSVVRCAIDEGLEVYGVYHGYEGLIDGDLHRLTRESVGDILQRGGTILKSARSERFMRPEGQAAAIETMKRFDIDGLVAIGGDGTFRGALDLTKKGVNVVGIPATIDNDLAYTNGTIGFDTAVNTVLDAISKIRDTSTSHERTVVIEVMGRHCGDIALYSGLAGGAEAVLIPEKEGDIEHICRKVTEGINRGKKQSVIIRAEGDPISSDELVNRLTEISGQNVRLVVLSYLQRGGAPTLKDRYIATMCGSKAVEVLLSTERSRLIGMDGEIAKSYDIEESLACKRQFRDDIYDLIDILSK